MTFSSTDSMQVMKTRDEIDKVKWFKNTALVTVRGMWGLAGCGEEGVRVQGLAWGGRHVSRAEE